VEVTDDALALDLAEFLRGMGYLARLDGGAAVEAILPLAPNAAVRTDLEALVRMWQRESGAEVSFA
jgi:hypothetical protein